MRNNQRNGSRKNVYSHEHRKKKKINCWLISAIVDPFRAKLSQNRFRGMEKVFILKSRAIKTFLQKKNFFQFLSCFFQISEGKIFFSQFRIGNVVAHILILVSSLIRPQNYGVVINEKPRVLSTQIVLCVGSERVRKMCII